MSETKFTPGPWAAADMVVFVPGDNPDGRGPETVAVVRMPRSIDESFANAALIAAAPELLAALQGALGYLADLNGSAWIQGNGVGERDMRQRAKALQALAFSAVSKAKGEA